MKINIYPVQQEYGGDFMKFCVRPAKNNLPEWYKKSSAYIGDPRNGLKKDNRMTIKRCMPVHDYLALDINLHTPFAIYAEGKYPNRDVYASMDDFNCKLGHHTIEQRQHLPLSDDYDEFPRKIDFPYYIESPAGYSALYIPSIPYDNFPLFFPSAIVQVDKYKSPVNFPFFIRKDFEGKIDAGTEFMKVIFIKREESEIVYKEASDLNSITDQYRKLVSAFGSGFYKKLRLDRAFD